MMRLFRDGNVNKLESIQIRIMPLNQKFSENLVREQEFL